MTTNPLDALAHLQDNPKQREQSTVAWLDANKDDVIALCQSKGIKMASELIGVTPATIHGWRNQRGLDFKSPRLSRDGHYVLEDKDGKRVRTDRYKDPARGEPVEPPPPEPAEYIRGQRDAYKQALALIAPAVKLPSHK